MVASDIPRGEREVIGHGKWEYLTSDSCRMGGDSFSTSGNLEIKIDHLANSGLSSSMDNPRPW